MVYIPFFLLTLHPVGYTIFLMAQKNVQSTIGKFLKKKRREAGLTQEDFAVKSGLGLRFIRELEQGKQTVRMDKVNQALAMFGYEAAPVKITRPASGEDSDE